LDSANQTVLVNVIDQFQIQYSVLDNHPEILSRNQTLGKIEKRVWQISWGRSVPRGWNAGAPPLGS